MKLCNKMYSVVLTLAMVFTLNNCSNEMISPQDEMGITSEDMVNKKDVSSASGQAGLVFAQGEYGFNGFQTFTFHVSKDAEGNVSGSWQSNYIDSLNEAYNLNTHGTIDCVTFDGNMAKMVGTITHSNGGEFWMVNWWSAPVAVGEYAYFEVADNGEGSKSDPDKFSDLFAGFDYPWFNLEILCDNYLTINMNDIYNGNIQVTNNEMD